MLDATPRAFTGLCLSLLVFTSTAIAGGRAPDEISTDGGFSLRNPGQSWDIDFDRRGFLVEPDAHSWSWGLELVSYGFVGSEHHVGEAACASSTGERVVYDWDDTLEEWYVNDSRGVEHGFTIHERPVRDASAPSQSAEPLTLTLRIRGELSPSVQANSRSVAFLDPQGSTALNYSGLIVFDADGQDLDARFEVSNGALLLSIDERNARYPLTVDPVAQEAYIKASNPDPRDHFAERLCLSGDTLIVGAREEDSGSLVNQSDNNASDAGAAYIFIRSGSSWSQQAYLKSPTPTLLGFFGSAVAVSGNTAVVSESNSGSGIVHVFERTGTSWTLEDSFVGSNTEPADAFGFSLAIEGDSIFVGAIGEDSAATGSNGNEADNSTGDSGAAYVFVRAGMTWSQQAYIKASNPSLFDHFGSAISASGNTLLVGAPQKANSKGAAYVFIRAGTSWTQQAELTPVFQQGGDLFGLAVGIDGETLVVGAKGESNFAIGVNGTITTMEGVNSGAAFVFVRAAGTWSQQAYLKASNTAFETQFGASVAISADRVIVGSPGENSAARGVNGNQFIGGHISSGAAYLFERTGLSWSQTTYLKASNASAQKQYGAASALSGDLLVIGDHDENGASSGINGDQMNGVKFESGAAYAYDLVAVLPTNLAGVDFCSGDGGDQIGCVDCPCMNDAPQGTIGGCLNRTANSARLFATGSTSVSQPQGVSTDLRFSLSGCPPNAFMILTSGDALAPTNPANPCFGVSAGVRSMVFDGLRCAVMNTRRHGGRSADSAGEVGTSNIPWGGESNPQVGLAIAGEGFVASQTRYFQVVYREDATLSCMRGLNTSQAIEIVFTP